MKPTVTIVDYGSGNLLSVQRAFEHCGADVTMARIPKDIEMAQLLVLPGVGAFSDGMQGLRERHFIEPIRSHALNRRPILGICLGMQMLATTSSEFGEHEGLNLVPGKVIPIPTESIDGKQLKIPQIGWSTLQLPLNRGDWKNTLLTGETLQTAMYHVHSFHFCPTDEGHTLATYDYGGHQITAAVKCGQITGLQFHPEKSAAAGLRVLRAFLASGTP